MAIRYVSLAERQPFLLVFEHFRKSKRLWAQSAVESIK
jgi:hypothetical protein